jgi:hypothetical protein
VSIKSPVVLPCYVSIAAFSTSSFAFAVRFLTTAQGHYTTIPFSLFYFCSMYCSMAPTSFSITA